MELAVTGIESVVTPAGKFNCYKVSFAAIGQTFWIGVEGARPLVKFQSGTVEAELVKVWGPENPVVDPWPRSPRRQARTSHEHQSRSGANPRHGDVMWPRNIGSLT